MAGHTGGRFSGGSNLGRREFVDLDRDDLHIEDFNAPGNAEADYTTDAAEQAHVFSALEDHINVFIEAFNAHDVEHLVDAVADDVEAPGLGGDGEGLPTAMQDVWDRRPNVMLTRGRLDDDPVAVVWDVGEAGSWDRIALLAFHQADGDGQIGVVEVVDDALEIESAMTGRPDNDHAEGVTWEEWYEG